MVQSKRFFVKRQNIVPRNHPFLLITHKNVENPQLPSEPIFWIIPPTAIKHSSVAVHEIPNVESADSHCEEEIYPNHNAKNIKNKIGNSYQHPFPTPLFVFLLKLFEVFQVTVFIKNRFADRIPCNSNHYNYDWHIYNRIKNSMELCQNADCHSCWEDYMTTAHSTKNSLCLRLCSILPDIATSYYSFARLFGSFKVFCTQSITKENCYHNT